MTITREDWRELPHLIADPMTVNHDRAHAEHIAYLSDGYAPGPPLLPRRRLTPLGIMLLWVLKSIPAAVVIVLALLLALLLARGLLGGL